jgi:hypothetical protein
LAQRSGPVHLLCAACFRLVSRIMNLLFCRTPQLLPAAHCAGVLISSSKQAARHSCALCIPGCHLPLTGGLAEQALLLLLCILAHAPLLAAVRRVHSSSAAISHQVQAVCSDGRVRAKLELNISAYS